MINTHKTYDFPNGYIHKLANGTYREQPKWCLAISIERPRAYVADALRQLRAMNRQRAA